MARRRWLRAFRVACEPLCFVADPAAVGSLRPSRGSGHATRFSGTRSSGSSSGSDDAPAHLGMTDTSLLSITGALL